MLKLFRSAGQDHHHISDCGDFIIRILGGADGVVLRLRAGMLLSWVKIAAPLIRGQYAPVALSCWLCRQPPRSTARAVSSFGTFRT